MGWTPIRSTIKAAGFRERSENEDIPEGFSYAVSDNVPTCRLLNGPYSGNYDDSQVYVLDGFIVSDNLKIDQVEKYRHTVRIYRSSAGKIKCNIKNNIPKYNLFISLPFPAG